MNRTRRTLLLTPLRVNMDTFYAYSRLPMYQRRTPVLRQLSDAQVCACRASPYTPLPNLDTESGPLRFVVRGGNFRNLS